MLSGVSVPINENDYFAGRVVEALPYEGLKTANGLLNSIGHLSPDYGKVLTYGLKGIVSEINDIANEKGDAESESFAENARVVAEAVRDYCLRYAKEAEKSGFAIDNEEFAKGIICIAVPVFDYAGNVVATIGISSLTLYDDTDSLICEKFKLLKNIADQVSANLGNQKN